MKKFTYRFGGVIASLAMVIAVTASNRTCVFILKQPELPNSVKALRKF